MLKKIVLLSVMAVMAFASSAFAEKKELVNGIDANYPPFAYIEKNDQATGFDIDAMNWIADKMGFKVVHKPMDWDGIVPSLMAKKIDMVASGMSITDERKEKVNFSNPYYTIKKYFVVKNNSKLTPDDIRSGKKKLGVQAGTNEAKWLEENAKANNWNYELRLYSSPGLAIEDVVNGRIDAAAIDSPPAEDAIKRTKKPIKIIGEFTNSDQFGVAVRKEDKELLETINKGYELLMEDPYWVTLHKKYFNAEPSVVTPVSDNKASGKKAN
ncbi:ABC transporter substrate-binding protein [Desulfovibrio litoralis]|uniref:Amino acid ABC transporter substrate-binding protein, PAAT family n=1 Tax=Desulfovibrio litoralis DSM 11393 TaxID=1121455 RepID=A0A1M7SA83_9BACT|nr:ABC transporter substrate-binding protein [Desulfovibrio litoralis]SHN55380.1 amino acid ABC transporter substrate-binding protein, PAAT family [Desulfovibrio litoralis DSM 11393]